MVPNTEPWGTRDISRRPKNCKKIGYIKKGNKNSITNYLPISLLPTLSKVFERFIFNQLYTYLDHNNILSEQHRLHSACNRQEINTCQHIDLSKAFDTLNFDILLYKLHYYGITDIALKLQKKYMSNKKQYVKYNVNEFGFKEIKTGVPQGSILGHLIFSIYINDLSTISKTLKCIMYANC